MSIIEIPGIRVEFDTPYSVEDVRNAIALLQVVERGFKREAERIQDRLNEAPVASPAPLDWHRVDDVTPVTGVIVSVKRSTGEPPRDMVAFTTDSSIPDAVAMIGRKWLGWMRVLNGVPIGEVLPMAPADQWAEAGRAIATWWKAGDVLPPYNAVLMVERVEVWGDSWTSARRTSLAFHEADRQGGAVIGSGAGYAGWLESSQSGTIISHTARPGDKWRFE